MRKFLTIILFVFAACDEEQAQPWTDCLQSVSDAPACSSEDDRINWQTQCEADKADHWSYFIASCENLEARAQRASCGDEFKSFLNCLENNGTCL